METYEEQDRRILELEDQLEDANRILKWATQRAECRMDLVALLIELTEQQRGRILELEERTLEGIREALDEAYNRMKYAAAEYEAIGAHEEAKRAEEIRKAILALSMERW